MTNQETIKMLTAKVECIRRETSGTDIDCNLRNCDDCELCYAQGTTGEQMKALNMAISALQAQDLQPTCNKLATDCISRQDAIDALRYAQHRFTVADEAGGMGTVKWSEDVIYFAAAERILTELPPAQPEPCEDAVSRNAIIQKLNTMDRYVSEELILCDTDKKFPKNEVFIVDDVYEEIVENLPSAQPDLPEWAKKVEEYRKSAPDTIHNPLAWALYQVWKEYDR